LLLERTVFGFESYFVFHYILITHILFILFP
jgi:hypothetical protein